MRGLRWLLVLCLVALVACSGQIATEDRVQDEADSTGSGPIKTGGMFRMAIVGDPQTLDPHLSASHLTHMRLGLAMSKLVTFKTGPDVAYTDYIIVPDLAEDWEISEDGLVYTFYLRKDAKWHNIPPVNGRPVVADDVVATMERIQRLPGLQAYMLEKVENIEAPDDHTVVFTLNQPFAPFMNYLAGQFMWIIPREGAEGQYDLNTTVIGSGPFIMEKWEKGVKTVYRKNPDYYLQGLPYLDGIEMLTIKDPATSVAAFRTGQLDILGSSDASFEAKENILRTMPEVQVIELMVNSHNVIYVNQDREPFHDLRVRKAISMAVNRQPMVDAIYGPGGETSGPIPPVLGKWALPLEEREAYLYYDPEEAR